MKEEESNIDKYKDFQLTAEQLDTLRELGNIGSGHAITALSDILRNEVDVSLTSLDFTSFWEIPKLFEDINTEVFGIYSQIKDQFNMAVIQFFTKESVINLINILSDQENISGDDIKSVSDLDELSRSIIIEIGNILAGNYSNALADLMSIKLIPGIPKLALDDINAMLEGIIARFSQVSDYSILIKTILKVKETELFGIICLIPSIEILDNLFKALNVKFDLDL